MIKSFKVIHPDFGQSETVFNQYVHAIITPGVWHGITEHVTNVRTGNYF